MMQHPPALRATPLTGGFDSGAGAWGFTLAELVVATTVLTIVMSSVYIAFGSATRAWREAEANGSTFQEARIALNAMSHELNCIVGGSEHLFEGKDDEFEFFAVTPAMNVEKGEGPQLLWVRYKINRTQKRLEREEAIVKGPLPAPPQDKKELERGRIKLGSKHEFTMTGNVRDFKVSYIWLPKDERKPDEPPVYLEPIVMERSKQGWGLPQGIKVELTIDDPGSETKRTTFTSQTTFRIPQQRYDEKRMGEDK